MPFRSIDELPARVKTAFPGERQRLVFVRAFNAAFNGTCRDGGEQGDRESCSFAVATAAAVRLTRSEGRMKGLAKFLEGLGSLLGSDAEDELDKALHTHDGDGGGAGGTRPCPPGMTRDETTGKCRKATAAETREAGKARKEIGKEIALSHIVPIVKIDHERRLIASVVYEPDVEDAHGDAMTRDEIEKSCHGFGIRYAQGYGELGTNHQDEASRAAIVPVESFLAPADYYLGKQFVTEGSWVMWSKVIDEELWKEVKAGTYTGYSFEGWGTRVAAA